MKHVEDAAPAQVVMPVNELHGRTVWSESGTRIGTVTGVNQDEDGRIVSLDVRERWMLGPHHEVPAAGMRIDSGDVIVPAGATVDDDRRDTSDATVERSAPVTSRRSGASFAPAPVLLSGREGARGRFGGLDIVGSFFGALVAIASLVLVGGVLAAIFGSEAASIDTSLDSLDAILTESLLVAGATIFLASFLGGWAAGRSARFDGVGNGIMSAVWVLVIGVVLGALGAMLGDEFNVFANVDLPRFQTDEFALWGSMALLVALALMLVGGALGGALGESWHRRADRAMLDVVSFGDHGDGARDPGEGDTVVTAAPATRTSDDETLPATDRGDRRHT